MPKMHLDFGSVGGIPEEGVYTFQVAECEEKISQKGNPGLNFKHTINGHEEWDGFAVWDYISLTPQARWRVQQVLEGITGKPWREDSMELDPRDLIGLKFRGVLVHDEYEGRPKAKIHEYYPLEGAEGSTPGDSPVGWAGSAF